MKNIISILFLAFFSISAQAHTSNDPINQENSAQTEQQEIMVTSIGFDKVLSLLLFNMEENTLEVELSQNSAGVIYRTTVKTSDQEVLELDFNDFETGTYSIKLVAGEYSVVHTIMLP